ncbi:hypothetical protein GE061_015638 [Apolygus lucorum]|uniref:Uncharacterized protein n=1 Tax=Apolygus lucorum TaxID=248454 RepID=A0A8S9XMQ2_APOLU|nr:hypothetical protein GE061_015638 [Apolygus lucorum]
MSPSPGMLTRLNFLELADDDVPKRQLKLYALQVKRLKEEHECSKFKTLEERTNEIKQFCRICFGKTHESKNCRQNKPCFHCKKRRSHHRSLCPNLFVEGSKESLEKRSGEEAGLLAMNENVLMKTLTADLYNPDEESTRLATSVGVEEQKPLSSVVSFSPSPFSFIYWYKWPVLTPYGAQSSHLRSTNFYQRETGSIANLPPDIGVQADPETLIPPSEEEGKLVRVKVRWWGQDPEALALFHYYGTRLIFRRLPSDLLGFSRRLRSFEETSKKRLTKHEITQFVIAQVSAHRSSISIRNPTTHSFSSKTS